MDEHKVPPIQHGLDNGDEANESKNSERFRSSDCLSNTQQLSTASLPEYGDTKELLKSIYESQTMQNETIRGFHDCETRRERLESNLLTNSERNNTMSYNEFASNLKNSSDYGDVRSFLERKRLTSDKDMAEETVKDLLNSLLRTFGKMHLHAAAPYTIESYPIPEDYIQNFLMFYGMQSTFEAFQNEWYKQRLGNGSSTLQFSLKQPHSTPKAATTDSLKSSIAMPVPTLHLQNLLLQQEKQALVEELASVKQNEGNARAAAETMRKEKNNQFIHNRHLSVENKELTTKCKSLLSEQEKGRQETKELYQKLSNMSKERSLLRMERDRLQSRLQTVQTDYEVLNASKTFNNPGNSSEGTHSNGVTQTTAKGKGGKHTHDKDSSFRWPPPNRTNPHQEASSLPSVDEKVLSIVLCNKGHTAAISGLAFNPRTHLLGTVSDDGTWKLWNIPGGELVMSGEGHESWVSAISFHHQGDVFATASGDCKIKIWSILSESCVHTISCHTQPIWDVTFHDIGDFFVSASLDSTLRCFDTKSMKWRQTLRGHTDSVNAVCFVPYTNVVVSASKDKTVALWDLRMGQSVVELYGHFNPCNHVATNLQGTAIASTDTKGSIKLWDIRTTTEMGDALIGPESANCCAFDRSGSILAIGSSSSALKFMNVARREVSWSVAKHTSSIQAIQFDPTYTKLATASSDSTFHIWKTMEEGANI